MTVTPPDPATVDWTEVEAIVHTMVMVNGYPRQTTVAALAQEELDALIPPRISPSPSTFAPNITTQQVIQVTTAGPLGAIPGNIATTGPNAGTPQVQMAAVTAAREAGATGPFPKEGAQSQPARQAIPPIPPDDNNKRKW